MKINYFSIIFWFNIFDNHNDFLSKLSEFFKEEFTNFQVLNNEANLYVPIIKSRSEKDKTEFTFSKINFQYNKYNCEFKDVVKFKEKVLNLFELLSDNGLEILHCDICINAEKEDEDTLKNITSKTLSKGINTSSLVDVSLKLGKNVEDLFYKVITVQNKKQIELPMKKDEKDRLIPIPLISWHNNFGQKEITDIIYEINDKYSFDFTKDYHTTEFYLNKMLYLLEQDFENDVTNFLQKGKF